MGLFYFYGVSVGEGRMNGYIKSCELIDGFSKSWFPQYQRDRVMRKKKINDLIDIFKNNKPIDSVKINFIGKHELYDTEAILEGKLHFIDGQQRVRALVDAGNREYKLPVELYLNLPYEEEVRLFHQYNRDATKLTFGDLIKSSSGIYPDIIRRFVKRKDVPVPVAINSSANGVNLPVFCPILWLVHRKFANGILSERAPTGNRLIEMLSKDHDEKQALIVEFALNNLLASYAEIFGDFDNKATYYRRAFIMPCLHVFINFFLESNGKVDFGKFKGKVRDFTALPNNSRVKELMSRGGDPSSMIEMYNIFIDELNHKLKHGHLPSFTDIKMERTMVEEGMIKRTETFEGKHL